MKNTNLPDMQIILHIVIVIRVPYAIIAWYCILFNLKFLISKYKLEYSATIKDSEGTTLDLDYIDFSWLSTTQHNIGK